MGNPGPGDQGWETLVLEIRGGKPCSWRSGVGNPGPRDQGWETLLLEIRGGKPWSWRSGVGNPWSWRSGVGNPGPGDQGWETLVLEIRGGKPWSWRSGVGNPGPGEPQGVAGFCFHRKISSRFSPRKPGEASYLCNRLLSVREASVPCGSPGAGLPRPGLMEPPSLVWGPLGVALGGYLYLGFHRPCYLVLPLGLGGPFLLML